MPVAAFVGFAAAYVAAAVLPSSATVAWIVAAWLGAILALTAHQSRIVRRELAAERELEGVVRRFTQRSAGSASLDESLRALEADIQATFDVAHAWIDIAGIDRPRRALPGTAVVRVTWNDEEVARIAAAHSGGQPVGDELLRRLERLGTFVGAVIGQADALRRREAARVQLREADTLRDKFLAMASHELRTPLTSIRGFSETMLRQWDDLADEDKLRFLKIVATQSDRLSQLVDDVMLLSGIRSGRFTLQPVSVRVEHAIDRAVRELGVTHVEVACDAQVRVSADPDHVQRMIANYVDNAVRHGDGSVSITCETCDDDVIVTVADAGPGVRKALQSRLFGEFQRERGGKVSHGPGLGLSVVRTLARAYGGDAWHEPNEPAGSRFLVRLPAARR